MNMQMTREETVRGLRKFVHQFDGRDVEDAFVEEVLEAAADMLEQDVPRWINVKDRLPPEKHYGPTPAVGFKCSDVCLVAADICGIDYTVAQDWTIDGVWRRYAGYVTHWMPMPEPPRGEREIGETSDARP